MSCENKRYIICLCCFLIGYFIAKHWTNLFVKNQSKWEMLQSGRVCWSYNYVPMQAQGQNCPGVNILGNFKQNHLPNQVFRDFARCFYYIRCFSSVVFRKHSAHSLFIVEYWNNWITQNFVPSNFQTKSPHSINFITATILLAEGFSLFIPIENNTE